MEGSFGMLSEGGMVEGRQGNEYVGGMLAGSAAVYRNCPPQQFERLIFRQQHIAAVATL